MILVPTPIAGYPNTTLRVTLDDATYRVTWLWNQRARCWAFSLEGPSGDAVVQGVHVRLNADLLAFAPPDGNRPAGGIFVIDPSGGQLEPGKDDLGARVKVVYVEAGDA